MRRSYITFFHIADLHLGRMATGGKIKLPYDKARQRQKEGFEVLRRALERAKEMKADVVLIAGDLWENDQIVPEQIGEVMRCIEEIELPVVLTPGNHDGVKEMGYHQPAMLSHITGRRFPPNLHIFRNYQEFECFTLPQLEGVQFAGLAYQDSQPVTERRLSQLVRLPQAEITVGIVHGTRQGIPLEKGKYNYLPFSDEELLQQPMDYVALGHYHSHSVIRDSQERVRGAYPGALVGYTLQESQERGAIWGVVEKGGVRYDPDHFQLITDLDNRRVVAWELDITPYNEVGELERAIEYQAQQSGISGEDILFIEFNGLWGGGGNLLLSTSFLQELAWHISFSQEKVMFYSPENLEEIRNRRDVVGEFVNLMLQKHNELREDPDAQRRVERALQYGLLALHNRIHSIRPPEVELDESI